MTISLASGTEHRDQFRLVADATLGAGTAEKATMQLGGDNTSSLIGLPWPSTEVQSDLTWSKKIWAPIDIPSGHYRPTSKQIGQSPDLPHHRYATFEKAKPAPMMRFLQTPYLGADMAAGAGIDMRPVSSKGTFSLAEKQAALLQGAETRHVERMAATNEWTAARSTTGLVPAVPNAYLTSTLASYQSRPPADSQQHRLRGFTTSNFVQEHPLNSAPQRCPMAPLADSSALHSQRFLGLRDSDGSRRLLEVGTEDALADSARMAASAAAESGPLPAPPLARTFVSSQPTTRSMDTVDQMEHGDVTIKPLERQPWPADAIPATKYRRPFAMDYHYGMMRFQEYKIDQQKAVARGSQ